MFEIKPHILLYNVSYCLSLDLVLNKIEEKYFLYLQALCKLFLCSYFAIEFQALSEK
jgi:hypothetical protein